MEDNTIEKLTYIIQKDQCHKDHLKGLQSCSRLKKIKRLDNEMQYRILGWILTGENKQTNKQPQTLKRTLSRQLTKLKYGLWIKAL